MSVYKILNLFLMLVNFAVVFLKYLYLKFNTSKDYLSWDLIFYYFYQIYYENIQKFGVKNV